MPLYHAIGNALVDQNEINRLANSLSSYERGESAEVKFKHGLVSQHISGPILRNDSGEPIPFRPIGLGKPLTVQLRHVYRGAAGPGKRMLVTSAMKPISHYKAAPRAINFLTEPIQKQRGFSTVAATEPGTPIVYYSPALIVGSSALTIDVGFDDYSDRVLTTISEILQKSGTIPAFMSYGMYLVGAGFIAKLANRIMKKFLEKPPVVSQTQAIDFVTPGTNASQSGLKVLAPEDFPRDILDKYEVDGSGQLVDPNNKPYRGDLPYVTFSLDGTDRKDLAKFEATQASASMLSDYFAIPEGGETNSHLVVEALQLYNDLKFRRQSEKVKEEIGATDDREEKAKLKKEYDALIKNIKEDKLRPNTE